MAISFSAGDLDPDNARLRHSPGQGDCWNHIGVSGDRSCPELAPLVHCRNCPVFAAAARTFFDRPPPQGYLAEWSAWLADSHAGAAGQPDKPDAGRETTESQGDQLSVLVFRLGAEYLAIGTHALAEVTTIRPVHSVPHRSNQILAGLVNLRGQVELCVSLHGLLGALASEGLARLVVLYDRDRRESWAFPVDDAFGVERISRSQSHAVPSTLANPAVGFSQAILSWNGRTVALLDEQRVFAALRRFGR
jgi:chemotaxis-related protein WspD